MTFKDSGFICYAIKLLCWCVRGRVWRVVCGVSISLAASVHVCFLCVAKTSKSLKSIAIAA